MFLPLYCGQRDSGPRRSVSWSAGTHPKSGRGLERKMGYEGRPFDLMSLHVYEHCCAGMTRGIVEKFTPCICEEPLRADPLSAVCLRAAWRFPLAPGQPDANWQDRSSASLLSAPTQQNAPQIPFSWLAGPRCRFAAKGDGAPKSRPRFSVHSSVHEILNRKSAA